MNWKSRVRELEEGLSRIYDVVAKVSVDLHHVELEEQMWSVKSQESLLSYDRALMRISASMDAGVTDFWNATTALALIFDKAKEQAADDLAGWRNKEVQDVKTKNVR